MAEPEEMKEEVKEEEKTPSVFDLFFSWIKAKKKSMEKEVT